MAGKMDSIKAPDLNALNDKQNKSLKNSSLHGINDTSVTYRPGFDKAVKGAKDFEVKKPGLDSTDAEDYLEEFSTKSARDARNRGKADHYDEGVKVGKRYVARRRILTAAGIFILAGLMIIFFTPPIFAANDTESGCRYEDIFGSIGSSQFKTQIMGSGYVYNIDAMSSDLSESYRICTVAFDVNNYSPLPVTIDDYVISGGGEFPDHVVYSFAQDDSKKIASMAKKTVYVDILINKDGLSDSDFDRAITTLTLTTRGMKKFGVIPCIPAVMNVSDVISFDPD